MPGAGQKLMRLYAAALNRRDVYLLDEATQAAGTAPFIPLSDGAGELIEVDLSVARWRPGDRVITTFFPFWLN